LCYEQLMVFDAQNYTIDGQFLNTQNSNSNYIGCLTTSYREVEFCCIKINLKKWDFTNI
jgi:hypothetical protein